MFRVCQFFQEEFLYNNRKSNLKRRRDRDGSDVKTTSKEKIYKFFILLIIYYASINVCIYIKEKNKIEKI